MARALTARADVALSGLRLLQFAEWVTSEADDPVTTPLTIVVVVNVAVICKDAPRATVADVGLRFNLYLYRV